MAQQSTKNNIKQAALTCFNQIGMANARLQHIADAANMSVGNLTYHFRTKEDIVRALWGELVQDQALLLKEFSVLPLFEDIERLIRHLFGLQNTYTFFYLDTLELMRGYPDIQHAYVQQLTWQGQQLACALDFNVARGALRYPTLPTHAAAQLANHFWLVADTWKYQRHVQGLDPQEVCAFRLALWSILMPCFTDMGVQEYQQVTALFEQGNIFTPNKNSV